MSELSPRLGLPFLMAAQAQKHVTHNEALLRLDQVTQLVLQALDATDPPADPDEGQVWALGAAPTGAWAGRGGDLALWFDGAWQFVTPGAGWQAGFGTAAVVFDGSAWIAPDLPALQNLPGVGINASFDATNRLSVAAEATLLTHEGAGHQLKINKAVPADTASLLYQTGFSGRAEMGTAGSDDFALKVSPDGAAWYDALIASRTSGLVSLPNGLSVSGALTLPADSVTRAALTSGAALSLIGRSANSAGAVADIAAGTDHQVMRRSGAAIGFGALALNQPAAVTGSLGLANGGTGAATAAAARINLGLGNAATADVTSGDTDITIGRLMRTRDHGLGVAITLTAGDNLNNLPRRSAFYFNPLSANTAGNNYPVSSAGSLLQVSDGNSGRATQIFTRFGTAATHVRSLGSGEIWSPWREIYTQASILGTVSQSGGVPTGAIIQRGSNANGEFVRFADGTQICWVPSAVQEIATASGGIHQSALYEINLPAAFAGDYAGSVSVTGTTIAWGNARRIGVATAQVRLFRGTSDSSPVGYIACFFGRWL